MISSHLLILFSFLNIFLYTSNSVVTDLFYSVPASGGVVTMLFYVIILMFFVVIFIEDGEVEEGTV